MKTVSYRYTFILPCARLDDDDAGLVKWEDSTLTTADRRILLANWYFKAVKKALEGEAKCKYFEHAGALLTADAARTTSSSSLLEGTHRADIVSRFSVSVA